MRTLADYAEVELTLARYSPRCLAIEPLGSGAFMKKQMLAAVAIAILVGTNALAGDFSDNRISGHYSRTVAI